ncbi:hypothetical protein [Streptomyces griseus]|uniref:hypothetical protein n=1 Tax=Streptomyces griseus TaxID=1911 RepID=UPI0033C8DDC9
MSAPWSALVDEDYRYPLTLTVAHIGWWGTVIIVLLRATEIIPPQWGLIAVLTIGIAVTASLSLSRMRFAKTIAGVFQTGLTTAVTLNANVLTDACIVSLNPEGVIESADHADAIGWETDALTGRELRTLFAPVAGGTRKIQPGSTIQTPMKTQKGELFGARISVVSLQTGDGSTNGAGHRVIATIAPINAGALSP